MQPDAPADRAELVEVMARELWERDDVRGWEESPDMVRGFYRDTARAVLAALEARGVRLVPAEATEEMANDGWIDKEDVDPVDIYRAMIAASPYAPEGRV